MNLASHPLLEAICGEYLLGTLKGPARRRFESVLAREPLVQLTLKNLENMFTPNFANMPAEQPSPQVWVRIEQTVGAGISAAQSSDHAHAPTLGWLGVLWKNAWGVGIGLAMAVILSMGAFNMAPKFMQPSIMVTSVVQGKQLQVILTSDRTPLTLAGTLEVTAQADQSYELWLVPASGGAPQSLGLLGQLDISPAKTISLITQVRSGAKLAVSIEPKTGSPTGNPTGPVTVLGAKAG